MHGWPCCTQHTCVPAAEQRPASSVASQGTSGWGETEWSEVSVGERQDTAAMPQVPTAPITHQHIHTHTNTHTHGRAHTRARAHTHTLTRTHARTHHTHPHTHAQQTRTHTGSTMRSPYLSMTTGTPTCCREFGSDRGRKKRWRIETDLPEDQG